MFSPNAGGMPNPGPDMAHLTSDDTVTDAMKSSIAHQVVRPSDHLEDLLVYNSETESSAIYVDLGNLVEEDGTPKLVQILRRLLGTHPGPVRNAFPYAEKCKGSSKKQGDAPSPSQEQLMAEINGACAGLLLTERVHAQFDKALVVQNEVTGLPRDGPWRSLSLHRASLHDRHDFLLQHHVVSPGIGKLACKCTMPVYAPRGGIPFQAGDLQYLPPYARSPRNVIHDASPSGSNLTFFELQRGRTHLIPAAAHEATQLSVQETQRGNRNDDAQQEKGKSDDKLFNRPIPTAPQRCPCARLKYTHPIRSIIFNFTIQRIIRLLLKLLPALLASVLLSSVPLATCIPQPTPYRTPKILLISLSALSSLGTGMTSLQLELLDDGSHGGTGGDDSHVSLRHQTQLTRMWLRIACSVSLALLAVGYTLWFLQANGWYKKRAFLFGFWGCSVFCWVFVSPGFAASAGEKGTPGDGFGWLDGVNLFGLIAVVVGILNAESSLFAGLFSSPDGDQGDGDGDGGSGRRGDVESQSLRGGRRRDEDEGRNPGGDRPGARDGGDGAEITSNTGLGLLSLANSVLGG